MKDNRPQNSIVKLGLGFLFFFLLAGLIGITVLAAPKNISEGSLGNALLYVQTGSDAVSSTTTENILSSRVCRKCVKYF